MRKRRQRYRLSVDCIDLVIQVAEVERSLLRRCNRKTNLNIQGTPRACELREKQTILHVNVDKDE